MSSSVSSRLRWTVPLMMPQVYLLTTRRYQGGPVDRPDTVVKTVAVQVLTDRKSVV